MRIVHQRVAGLDVHKRSVVATRMQVDSEDRLVWETRTFGTTTPELLQLLDWLVEWEVTHVAMESTGDFWKPIYNILEGHCEVLLVNAQHVKHVPGRKTDVGDAEWLAELLLHGLLKASFIPPKPQRALREFTRYRTTVIQERTRVIARVQKLLEGANIKLASVVSDTMGVSARAMLNALVNGQADPAQMADLARGRLRTKLAALEQALTGLVEAQHRFVLARQLAHVDFLDEQIEELSTEIARYLEELSTRPPSREGTEAPGGNVETQPAQPGPLTWTEAVELLDSMPGVNQRTAEVLLAEIGLDMRQFPTADDLASWTGLAPGNRESGGKRYSGRTTKGNRFVKSIMVEAAWTVSRAKGTFLKARYDRLVVRRGKKRALVAVAHSMIVSAWHMLTHRIPYHELGGDFFDRRQKEAKADYHLRQLQKLGYQVSLETVSASA